MDERLVVHVFIRDTWAFSKCSLKALEIAVQQKFHTFGNLLLHKITTPVVPRSTLRAILDVSLNTVLPVI